MSNSVKQVLGGKRINEICKMYHLTPKDRETINKTIGEWKNLPGQMEQKLKVADETLKNNPHRTNIISALIKISAEFSIKSAGRHTN